MEILLVHFNLTFTEFYSFIAATILSLVISNIISYYYDNSAFDELSDEEYKPNNAIRSDLITYLFPKKLVNPARISIVLLILLVILGILLGCYVY